MSYAKWSGDAYQNPKIRGVTLAAVGLWALSISYCAKWKTDGIIPFDAVQDLSGKRVHARVIQELVDADLWHRDRANEVYIVNDYTTHNLTRAQLDKLESERRAAGKKGAKARWQDES